MSVIFFDNRTDEITDMINSACTAIHVADTIPNPRIHATDNRNGWDSYPRSFIGNQYAEMVMRYGGEEVMPSLGMTREHVAQLEGWISTRSSPLIAVFDWDRTLTVVEGMILPSNREWKSRRWPWSPSDTILYLMGGATRLRMIQEMFERLHANGVHVFIATRNSSAVGSRESFYELIHYIYPAFSLNHLIYAGLTASKSDALKHHREYQRLIGRWNDAVVQGGKRRRSRHGSRRGPRKTGRKPQGHLKRDRD